MSKISTKAPSGMRDFLPEDIARRTHVVEQIKSVYQRYGFGKIADIGFWVGEQRDAEFLYELRL